MPQLQVGFEIFANWQTVVFCLGVYLLTYFIRTCVEAPAKHNPKMASLVASWVWQELWLPLGPIGTGLVLALLSKKFPWPMPLAESMSAKAMYGAICGLACGWMYARVRAWFGVAADGGNEFAAKVLKRPASVPPPANTPDPTDIPVDTDGPKV